METIEPQRGRERESEREREKDGGKRTMYSNKTGSLLRRLSVVDGGGTPIKSGGSNFTKSSCIDLHRKIRHEA